MTPPSPKWLLLIHQIPPKPDYFRVKIWRRLQRLGAVAIKNSVYVLPWSEQAVEDFQWVLREISAGGGDAAVCEARFVEGLSDPQVEDLFHQARDVDYEAIAGEASRLSDELPRGRPVTGERRSQVESEVARLRRRLATVVSIDHLLAPGRARAHRRIDALERRLRGRTTARRDDSPIEASRKGTQDEEEPGRKTARALDRAGATRASRPSYRYHGRIWVTRKGVHIDRMASAWLIRRFIDPRARFKFVAASGYRPGRREIRFDMYEAEFTHEADRCTFEVLMERFSLKDAALRPIAEIVHDIDLKDSRYGRDEAPGIERLVAGALTHRDDSKRITRAAALFDDLYEYFRGKRV